MNYFGAFISLPILLHLCYANDTFLSKKENHLPKELVDEEVQYLTGLSDLNHMNQLLDNILIERVVGTDGHDKVRNFIIQQLQDLNWDVEIDEFQENTPIFGNLIFRNIIASLNPNAERFLVLSCHYDSKYFENEEFLGATDSAVPCAMMLNLIHLLSHELDAVKSRNDLSLKLVFFDGEEAFKDWTDTDSLYGSRHLADQLGFTYFRTSTGENVTNIDRIDLLVLLDLIGFSNPQFYATFGRKWFTRMVNSEERLAKLNLLTGSHLNFNATPSNIIVLDDHIPFLMKNVSVVHLIPHPFPKEWHSSADNRDIVDLETTENINRVLRIFVAEYLHLSVNS